MTNEEFREVHGDPCEHSNTDLVICERGWDVYAVWECRDCGDVL